MTIEPIHFGWDREAANRVLSPGFPDLLVGVPGNFAWINDSGCWIWTGKDIWLYRSPDLQGLVLTRDLCILIQGEAPIFTVQGISPTTGRTIFKRSFNGRDIQVGNQLVVSNEGIERSLWDVRTGESISMPVGARDARPKPWMEGRGIVWVDRANIYRMVVDSRPQMVGSLPGVPTAWRVGPHGSAVFECDADNVGLNANGLLSKLPPLDIGTARFSCDGMSILAHANGGVSHIDLGTGAVRQHRKGALLPVGVCDEAVVLDEDAGILKLLGGGVVRHGFSPSDASMFADTLYGPGGTAWSLTEQTQLWDHTPLGGLFLVAHSEGVFQVDDRIKGFDGAGKQVLDIPMPIDESVDGEIEDVRWVGGLLEFEVRDGPIFVDHKGQRVVVEARDTRDWESSSTPSLLEVDLPVHAQQISYDGSTMTHDAFWCWNIDGMLLRFLKT